MMSTNALAKEQVEKAGGHRLPVGSRLPQQLLLPKVEWTPIACRQRRARMILYVVLPRFTPLNAENCHEFR